MKTILLLKNISRVLFLCVALLGMQTEVSAQIEMLTTGNHTQNFDGLVATGTSTFSIPNWYAQRSGNGTTYAADTGSSNAGNLYSYGATGNSDRALGSLGSSNAAAGNFAYGVQLQNTSTATITDIKITYTLEQWRNGGAAAQGLTFWYKITDTSVTNLTPNVNTTWTQVIGLASNGPISNGTAGALVGNNVANKVTKTNIPIPDLSLAPGEYILLKWDDPDHTGSDHGLSIDDVTISWTVTPVSTPPTVTTTVVSAIETNQAAAGGNVTSEGSASVTEKGIAFGTSTNPTTGTSDGTGAGSFSSSLTSLSVNTMYYYRAYATNSVGTSYGSEGSFYTLANTPETPVVDNATTSSLDVLIDDFDGNPANTQYAIQETTTGNYVTADGTLGAETWQTTVAWGIKTVTGLLNNTTYTFQVKARNGDNVETNFGGTASGQTEIILDPYFVTENISTTFGSHCLATNTQGSFDLYGFNLAGNVAVGPLDGYTFSTTEEGTYTASLSLVPDSGSVSETIHVRFTPVTAQEYNNNITIASAGAETVNVPATGTGIGSVDQAATTAAPTAITSTGATLHGALVTVGICPATTEKGFVYALVSENNDPLIDGTGVTASNVNDIETGTYSLPVSSLAAAQEYVYKAYVLNSDNTYTYGNAVTFMTVATAPSQPATIITFGTYTTNSIQLSWTNGNGAARIVVAKLSSTVGAVPQNGVAYNNNSASFTDDLNDITGTDNIVVYNGTDNTVTVTDLPSGTYNFSVYEYNGTGVTTSYSASAFGTKSTIAAEPTVQASNVTFTNVTATQFTINWTQGNGGNSLVIVKADSAVDAIPVDGTSYNASGTNTPFINGNEITTGNYVVYRNTLSSLVVTGLAEGTTYHVAVYTFNGDPGGTLTNYLTDNPATGSRIAETPTYYSQGSLAINNLNNWNSNPTGGGNVPASFSAKFVIQDGHSMTTSSTLTFPAASILEIASGGTLTATNSITFNATATFRLLAGGSYVHNTGGTLSTTIFAGIEQFATDSNFTFKNGLAGFGNSVTGGFGNLTLDISTANQTVGLSGALTEIKGDFILLNTNDWNYRLSNGDTTLHIGGNFIFDGGHMQLTNGSGNANVATVNVDGDLIVNSGSLGLANGTAPGIINVKGNVSLTGGTVARTGNSPLSRINFTNTGLQDFTSGSSIGAVTFDVHSGSITNLGTSVLSGTGAMNVLNGGTIQLGSPSASGAIAGNITATGGLVLSSTATVEYNAEGTQTISARSDYGSLIVSGSGTKNLNGNATVAIAVEITETAQVNVPSGFDINTPVVNVEPTASLTFQNNANLLQNPLEISNGNSGEIIYTRNSTMRRFDYVYWGSPVEGQNLGGFSPWTVQPQTPHSGATGSSRFYGLNETTNLFDVIAQPHTVSMVPGKGYMVRAPNNFPTAPDPVTAPQATFAGKFTGRPNNGTITIPISYSGAGRGYNMISNPYPSSVDADLFLGYTTDDGETYPNGGTLYFWTHYSQAAGGGANYASYNGTGEAAAGDGFVPDGIIASGQGFLLLKAEASTEATFTNAMRIDNNTPRFFRNANSVERHRIWMNLSSPTVERYNQALIGYVSGATQGIDNVYDGLLNYSGSSISSAIGTGTEKYVIQGRSLPFDTSDVVPMIFKAVTDGSYTISIDKVDGLFEAGQDIFLKDNENGIVHDIKNSAYTFASNVGTFNNRFEIVFQSTLGVENPVATQNSIIVYNENGVLNINSGATQMSDVKVFDIRGRLLFEQNGINATTTTVRGLNAAKQVLVVQVTADNKTISKKVVY